MSTDIMPTRVSGAQTRYCCGVTILQMQQACYKNQLLVEQGVWCHGADLGLSPPDFGIYQPA